MFGPKKCVNCRLMLDYSEFDFNRSTRRWASECKVCRHHRLAKHHALISDRHRNEAERLQRMRRQERDDYEERVAAARAAMGKD